MKFELTHSFEANIDLVWQTLLHPELPKALVQEVPDLLEMEILEVEENRGLITRRVRYRPAPVIEKVGPKKVEPRWMEWTENSEADPDRYRIEFENVPRVPQVARLMRNTGILELRPSKYGCTRVIRGELKIKVPILGRIAERIIHRKAGHLVDQEAAATARIAERGGVEAFLAA
jgi:hypothetical protein